MGKMKKVGNILASVLLWVIILIAALFTFTTLATKDTNNVANVFGYTPMTVQTDSMAPVFYSGDMIFIHSCDPEQLEVGDIVCFHTIIENEYVLNTHRIAEIDTDGPSRTYVTKGDNNMISDQHIIADGDIVGQYVGKVPGLGKFIDFLSSSTGFLLVIVLPLLVFFIYQVYHLVIIGMKVKRANALEAAQQQAEVLAQSSDGEAERMKAEAEQAKAEAEAALAEAKRLREEAEEKLAAAQKADEDKDKE